MEGDGSGALYGRCRVTNSTCTINAQNSKFNVLQGTSTTTTTSSGISTFVSINGSNINSLSKLECQRFKYFLGQNHSIELRSKDYPSGCFKMGGDFQDNTGKTIRRSGAQIHIKKQAQR